MKQYLELLKTIVEKGVRIPNRTGIDALTVPHMMIQHDMSEGFPLLTTKKMAWKTMKVELEGFLKGITDKKWYQERGCHIWDEWCNPQQLPRTLVALTEEERKAFQLKENDLGKIYGYQWRSFNGVKNNLNADQLKTIVDRLKTNPNDRRMVCSAWNPLQLHEMALPPCHLMWNVIVIGDKLNLCWAQRSVDSACGLPFNEGSYALLLHLLAKESGLKEGMLTGFLMNTHIYVNQLDGVKEQLSRTPYKLPRIETPNFKSIFDWEYGDTKILDYQHHEKIAFPIAV